MIKSVFLLTIGFTLLLTNASFAQTNMNYKKATSLDFYNEAVFQSLLTRLENIQPNTYFGPMTRKQWGKLIVIHCNHHFQQFNN